MASDRIELMFEILREIRATLDSHGKLLADNSEQFKAMRKEMHDWQETTATAAGFAMHANLRNNTLEEEFAALKQRVEKLEAAK